jgi:ADP-dependent NAD(P)H-hydrate dehydratase
MSDATILPQRPADGHKGTFGTVLVVGGASGARTMLGGPAFAALGALRSGCGLCELAMPAPLLVSGLSLAPSATGVSLPIDASGALDPAASLAALEPSLKRATVIAVGPGLGEGPGVEPFVRSLLQAAAQHELPIVLDADGLNAFARSANPAAFTTPAILSPHPGEFRRLADACGCGDLDPIDPRLRPESARVLAERLGAVVVLKGHGTCVAWQGRVEVESAGNPALATGGSGDVLTGLIAGLWSQWIAAARDRPPHASAVLAACSAVHLHATAADRWASEHGESGLLATDLLAAIPDAQQAIRSQDR